MSPQQRRRGTGKGPRQQRAEVRARSQREARVRAARRRTAAIVLGAAVVLTTAGFAIFRGLGNPSVPSGDVVVVDGAPDGHISTAEYQATLPQEVPRLGLKAQPKPGSPQYTQVKDAALSDLILQRWIEGEAQDRGVVVSQSEVLDNLAQIVKQQYGNSFKQLDKQLLQLHLTNQANCITSANSPPPACATAALERVRLNILSQRIQQQVLPSGQPPAVSEDAVRNYYDTNIAQFEQPQTRDFRLILNKSEASVTKAKAALGANPSPATWKQVARKYSTDPTTKTSGGLRSGVAKGQSEPALDRQVFSAPQGQLVGPFKGRTGWYLVQVEAVHPAQTQPFTKVQSQISQQLASAAQQQVVQSFQTQFVGKWTSRTFCSAAYVTDRCENFHAPAGAPGGALVPSTKPVPPGQATVFFTQPQGLPQGPISSGGGGGAALPGGTPIPLGPSGAPSGSVPPGG